jgi:di/tricarboxylate transporter
MVVEEKNTTTGASPRLWNTLLYLIMFSAYVVGGVVGVLLYPKPSNSFTRFVLWLVVGLLFALVAIYNPCIKQGLYQQKGSTPKRHWARSYSAFAYPRESDFPCPPAFCRDVPFVS